MIAAQLVGGPHHGEKLYAERDELRVAVPTNLPTAAWIPDHEHEGPPLESLTVKEGRYEARYEPHRPIIDNETGGWVMRRPFARLANGMVPFDWKGYV